MPSSKTMSARLRSWYRSNTFDHAQFTAERLAAQHDRTVSVCLPARNEAPTIGPILEALGQLRAQGIVDQIVVVDNSTDGTAQIARDLGAEVHDQEALWPEHGPVLGKGDAMWRSLRVLRGEIVCFLDADSEQFGAHFVRGLVGPLLCEPRISFVKGFYRRPFRIGDTTFPDGGGRVTELTARPLLNMFYPELAAIQQPLSGEIAARRDVLERLPFVTGYGVDIALLIDAHATLGLDAIAQVDLDVRQNAHQSLRDLGPMAYAVLQAVTSRLAREGRLDEALPTSFTAPGDDGPHTISSEPVQRPPLRSLRAAA
jgi:glucosyl-3-phosphoglycerate synthase